MVAGRESPVGEIEDILAMQTLDELEPAEALTAIGAATDFAADAADLELTTRVLAWGDDLEPRLESEEQRSVLDYFRANAWAIRQAARRGEGGATWSWDEVELERQVLLLRRALSSSGFANMPVVRCCQILTNLANQLDTAGRFVESRQLWDRALSLEPVFWMARANRARSLMFYARSLYDPGHAAVFALEAHKDMTRALEDIQKHPDLGNPNLERFFREHVLQIGQHFELAAIAEHFHPDQYSLGAGRAERAYRTWCLRERLFLNPLNDLGPHPIAAQDILTLPSFVVPVGEPPVLAGFFNQLKQEYVSARWHHYEGNTVEGTHCSDRGVLLYNTLDYPALGLRVEQVKMAFRMAYSLLDKIAYFLNYYLKLGIPERQISFRGVWREKDKGPIRPTFEASENWPLRGLHWLSKDLFETEFRDVMEPDARSLAELRNHLEHKYVKIHAMLVPRTGDSPADPFHDSLAHALSRTDLERKSLQILRLARSALIYLSLGMHREESRRRAQLEPDALVPAMPLDVWKDEWKRRM
jgi:hypothetical protein